MGNKDRHKRWLGTRNLQGLTQIEARRVLNQHNIDCMVLGKASNLCGCYGIYDEETRRHYVDVDNEYEDIYHSFSGIPCNRCEIRDEIRYGKASNRFIGFKIQR